MMAVTESYPPAEYHYPPAGRHHRDDDEPGPPAPRRRGPSPLTVFGLGGLAVAVVVGVTAAVFAAMRPGTTPAEAGTGAGVGSAAGPSRPALALGTPVLFRSSGTAASFKLDYGPQLTITAAGEVSSNGAFLGLSVVVTVQSGSVFVADDNFVLVTTAGRSYPPDMSFAFSGGLRGARVQAGQTVTGLVVWDLPVDAPAGGRVELRIGQDGPQGAWQLP